MKRRIVITEDQLKEYVKSSLNEKKSDFVTGFKDNGSNTSYYVNKEHPDYSEEALDKRIKNDEEKRVERKKNNNPEKKRNLEKAKKQAKVKKAQRNQLLLPFGDEEKCANRCKEKNLKKQ